MNLPFKTTETTVADASIWTGTGYMDLANPNPAEIHLADIARALSRLPRFNGYGRAFYSVAEHSVHCVRAFQGHAAGDIYADPFLRDIARDILLHDAAEAYLGDVTRPLKALLPDYKRLESRMEAAIAARFGLTNAAPAWVKQCDLEMLALEKQCLMPGAGTWPVLTGVLSPGFDLWCLDPDVAEREFLSVAEMLGLTGSGEGCA